MNIKQILAKFWYKTFNSYQRITEIKIELSYHTTEGNELLHREIIIEPKKPLYCEEDSWGQAKREVAKKYLEGDPVNKNITLHCEKYYKQLKKHKYAVGMYRKFETSILKGFFWKIDNIITEDLSYEEYLKHKGDINV